jgi:hypothetical protein
MSVVTSNGFIVKQSRSICLAHASGMFDSVRECGIRPDRSNVPTDMSNATVVLLKT